MTVKETAIEGAKIVEPQVFRDARGYFCETYNQERYNAAGIDACFVQDNESFSMKGVVRGLHWQAAPHTQAKLVRVIRGAVWDVVVDIRKGSPTYGKWVSCELSAENKRMFYLPKGMAHGFLTITDDVEFQYKCDELYNKESEGGIRYDDKTINVDWGTLLNGIEPVLSEKDKVAPDLEHCNANFVYEE